VTSALGTQEARNALTLLSRLAQRRPEARPLLERFLAPRLNVLAEPALDVVLETGEPCGEVLAQALEKHAELRLSERVMVRFESARYRSSPALRRTGLAVTRRALETWRARDDDTLRSTANLTYLWHNLGYWLHALGKNAEALEATRKALPRARSLAEREPERYRIRYARCLETYSARLEDSGQSKKSLAPRNEAIAILRELTLEQPDDPLLMDLSRALMSQSDSLKGLQRAEEALELAREATQVRRELADRSVAFDGALANTLDGFALRAKDCGQLQEALAAASEAVEILGRLAAEQPGAFTADYARSLSNLSIIQRNSGDVEGALASCKESLVRIDQARSRYPDAFDQHVASILVNLGLTLLELRKLDDALEAMNRSIAIRRPLVREEAVASMERLALALADRSAVLEAMGRYGEALSSIDEAIRIRRRLAAAEPEVFEPRLRRNLRLRTRIAQRGK